MIERVCGNEDGNGENQEASSIMLKTANEIYKELWSHVVTTKCPHCSNNSPAIRKDGFTKIFVKPLQGR